MRTTPDPDPAALIRLIHTLSDADRAIAVALLTRLPGLAGRLAAHHHAGQVPCQGWRGVPGVWADQALGVACRAVGPKRAGGES